MGMTLIARGILAAALALLLLGALLSASGCSGTGKGKVTVPTTSPFPTAPPSQPAITPPAPPTSSPHPPTTPTPVDLARPPQTAPPTSPPSVDPIVGTWYAPPPDDLTFEFHSDGTFTERSPNFRTYQGTWRISEEGQPDFYDADILDRWGYRKQAHLLYASGTLFTKGIGTMHRVP